MKNIELNMLKKIFFFPNYSGGNPYQSLLYTPAVTAGYTVIPGSIKDALLELENKNNEYKNFIFHLHWLNAFFANCTSAEEAWEIVRDFMLDVTLLKSSGGKLIWTIHNHIPHENTYPEQDLRLRYFLCSQADRIHLHCKSHINELHYLPLNLEKISIHRHGNYINAYGKFSITEKIRNKAANEIGAVFIGMIRGYKGIDTLLKTTSDLAKKGVYVTIAGKPDSVELEEKIKNHCNQYNIKHILRRLSGSEIHQLCSDNEIGILSYDNILTSGTLKLYLSYGMIIYSPRLKTITTEDRYNSFIYYNKNTDQDEAFNFLNIPQEEYKELAITSFFLAQESRWAASLFEFESQIS